VKNGLENDLGKWSQLLDTHLYKGHILLIDKNKEALNVCNGPFGKVMVCRR
jgi:hypothetical protein